MTARTPGHSTVKEARVDVEADRLDVIVTGESLYVSQPLPQSGEMVIGRATDADLRVDHPSISRNHAALRVAAGGGISIEDLGSANGTRLRGRSLPANERVEIRPGEVIDLGSVLLVVQPRPRAARARRVWTHDYFEVRVDEECTRASRGGGTFAVLFAASDVDDTEADDAQIRDVVVAALPSEDVIGRYAPGSFEALLVGSDPVGAERVARQIVTAAARAGVATRTGVAVYPRDGTSASALLAHATREAHDPTPGDRPPAPAPLTPPTGAMRDLHRLAEALAVGSISVLVLGETGAGKEVMAETIHRMSSRRAAPFLRLNCAALTESLLESELFGHERGAFTGAAKSKPGLLETADGGTVFLDEVGELAMSTQVKLLRVLEERQVLRVGGLKPRPIDVRFIAATNRDLEAEVERGVFRRDLYYRLGAATLVVPPLRERAGEIPELARVFATNAARDIGRAGPPPAIEPAAMRMLEDYAWPGNVRELRNMMERAVLLAGGGPIGVVHLPAEKMRATLAPAASPSQQMAAVAPPLPTRKSAPMAVAAPPHASNAPAPAPVAAPAGIAVPQPAPTLPVVPPADGANAPRLRDQVRAQVEQLERERIVEALARAAGNQSVAARLLGMPRRTLVKRLRAYNIPRPRSSQPD
jgi:two-component system, NtrC family, response regulator AtoC